eukprot:jgi/Mesvir1/2497/Mv14783-RA.1
MQCRGCALNELSDLMDALGPSPSLDQVNKTIMDFDKGMKVYKYAYRPKSLPPPPTGYPVSKCMSAICKKPALHAHEMVKEATPQMLETVPEIRLCKLVVGDIVCGICRNTLLTQLVDHNVVVSKVVHRGTLHLDYKRQIDEVFQYNEDLHKMAERALDNTYTGPGGKAYRPPMHCHKCSKHIDINVQNLYAAPRPRSSDIDLVCYECATFCSLVSEAIDFPPTPAQTTGSSVVRRPLAALVTMSRGPRSPISPSKV